MRVVVGGSSGMIGSGLVARLRERGDSVVRLVRGDSRGADEIQWDPSSGVLDPEALAGADAIVNLSGASISRLPWTRSWRREILASRVTATTAIVQAMHALERDGRTLPALISGSAVGFYGDRPDEEVTEESAAGGGFLAGVVRTWEAAALAAPEAARVVLARTGVVIGPHGATAPLRLLAKVGLAGPLGSGRQHWPWIALDDEIGALVHLIDTDVAGPVNLVAPHPATAADVIRQIALHESRPYWLPAPAIAITTVLGDAGRDLLIADQNIRPIRLDETGYVFLRPTIESAVAALA